MNGLRDIEGEGRFMSAQPRESGAKVSRLRPGTRGPVLVEAAAGTGKTTLLVERILHLIRARRGAYR